MTLQRANNDGAYRDLDHHDAMNDWLAELAPEERGRPHFTRDFFTPRALDEAQVPSPESTADTAQEISPSDSATAASPESRRALATHTDHRSAA